MDISTLLASPESKTLEFKRDLSSHGPILRTACAFANTAGGVLLVGIADDRSVLGMTDALSAEEKIASILAHGISPHLLPEIEILPWRGKSLLAVTVHPGPSRPYRVVSAASDRQVFVRVGSTNRAADGALIAELERSAHRGSFDEEPFLGHGARLEPERLAPHLASSRTLSRGRLLSLRLLTEHSGRTVPTVGGMLLAGADRDIHFPDAHVRAGKFGGTDRTAILDSREFHGGLLDSLERTLDRKSVV